MIYTWVICIAWVLFYCSQKFWAKIRHTFLGGSRFLISLEQVKFYIPLHSSASSQKYISRIHAMSKLLCTFAQNLIFAYGAPRFIPYCILGVPYYLGTQLCPYKPLDSPLYTPYMALKENKKSPF
jgi:hypothetical protein